MNHWRHQRKIKKNNLERNDNKNTMTQNLWDVAKKTVVKEKVYNITIPPQERRNFQMSNLTN